MRRIPSDSDARLFFFGGPHWINERIFERAARYKITNNLLLDTYIMFQFRLYNTTSKGYHNNETNEISS